MKSSANESPCLLGLPFSGQFLIWLLRTWVEEQRYPALERLNLKDGAQAAGLTDAIGDLDRFMRSLAASAPGVIVIERLDCQQLSADERLLLAALSGLQKGRLNDFEDLLATIVSPAAVRIARMPAAQLVGRFLREGLVLPNCPIELHEAETRLAVFPDPGAMRLQ